MKTNWSKVFFLFLIEFALKVLVLSWNVIMRGEADSETLFRLTFSLAADLKKEIHWPIDFLADSNDQQK